MSDEYDEKESDELGSESRSSSTFNTGLGGLLHGVWFPLDVTLYDDGS